MALAFSLGTAHASSSLCSAFAILCWHFAWSSALARGAETDINRPPKAAIDRNACMTRINFPNSLIFHLLLDGSSSMRDGQSRLFGFTAGFSCGSFCGACLAKTLSVHWQFRPTQFVCSRRPERWKSFGPLRDGKPRRSRPLPRCRQSRKN